MGLRMGLPEIQNQTPERTRFWLHRGKFTTQDVQAFAAVYYPTEDLSGRPRGVRDPTC